MKIVRQTLLAAAVVFVAASCAKQETVNAGVLEQESLDAWVSSHISDPTLKGYSNGMYTVVRTPAAAGAAEPKQNYWVLVNYDGYSMPDGAVNPTGNLFVTRDADKSARALASNTYRTHYVPHKLWMQPGYGLTEAMYATLLQMGEGAVWRYYAPSALTYGSYGSSYTYGYQGQSALPASVPSYMDIELVEVIPDISVWELAQAKNFAADTLPEVTDKEGLYLKKIPDYLPGYDDDPLQVDIKEDSTLSIYYVGKFLDGFVFDTNIDSIALRVFNDASTHTAISYKPSAGGRIQAFYDAVLTMKYNSWGRMVFTSTYGYGSTGQTPTDTAGSVIDPYEPLYFEFFIEPYVKPTTTTTTTSD